MNTNIYLWIEPLMMSHERCDKRFYFNCIINGDYIESGEIDLDKLDSLIAGDTMAEIMDFADIDSNWNYAVVSAKLTAKEPSISFADSPTDKKVKKEVAKAVTGKKEIIVKEKDIEIKDGGKLEISLPNLGIKDTIDFAKIWTNLEENFIGKINTGDIVNLTDEEGNKIFEMMGGNFLNIGVSDMTVKDAKTGNLKGGLFIREDGTIDIGDYNRTFYLRIYTDKLLKASLKLQKSLMEITQQKLLK
jgi:hypothetical protein